MKTIVIEKDENKFTNSRGKFPYVGGRVK